MRHVLELSDLTALDIEVVFCLTRDLKTKWIEGIREPLLPGRVLALLLESISFRTRVSFESAISQLGGRAVVLGSDVGFRTRENLADFCRVLSELVDVVVMRTIHHESLAKVASLSRCPVINGRTTIGHPCQALADLFTAAEVLGSLRGRKLAYLGQPDGLARSLAQGCARLGMPFVLAAPKCRQLGAGFVETIRRDFPAAEITITADALEAVHGAAVVYAGDWFPAKPVVNECDNVTDFQVTANLLERAPAKAFRMHCLRLDYHPALNGAVFDHRKSLVSAQISNRLHVQKGLLLWLLGSQGPDSRAGERERAAIHADSRN